MSPERRVVSDTINRLKILSKPYLRESTAVELHRAADEAIATVVASEVSQMSYRLGKLRVVIGLAEDWRDTFTDEQQRTDIDQAIEDLRLAKQDYADVGQ